jgi:hypothetical protein
MKGDLIYIPMGTVLVSEHGIDTIFVAPEETIGLIIDLNTYDMPIASEDGPLAEKCVAYEVLVGDSVYEFLHYEGDDPVLLVR